jgi:hypothetical protein
MAEGRLHLFAEGSNMKRTVPLLLLLFLALWPVAARAGEDEDRVQFGKDIVLEPGRSATDLICFGCSIRVRGTVLGDAVAFGGNIDVDGSITGDAVAMGGAVRLGPTASINGDAVGVGGGVELAPGSKVQGEVTSTTFLGPLGRRGLWGFLLLALFASVPLNLLLALLVYLIAGRGRVEVMAETLQEHTGKACLAGVGALVAVIILYTISAYLGPAAPVMAVAVSLGLVVTLIVGYTGISFWTGRGIGGRARPWVVLLLGALLITVVQCVPLLGFLAIILFVLLALGGAVLSGYGTSTAWLQKQVTGTQPARTPTPPASA